MSNPGRRYVVLTAPDDQPVLVEMVRVGTSPKGRKTYWRSVGLDPHRDMAGNTDGDHPSPTPEAAVRRYQIGWAVAVAFSDEDPDRLIRLIVRAERLIEALNSRAPAGTRT